jgi:hypothetical protein
VLSRDATIRPITELWSARRFRSGFTGLIKFQKHDPTIAAKDIEGLGSPLSSRLKRKAVRLLFAI